MGLFLFAALALLGATGAVVAVTTFSRMMAGLPSPSALENIEFPERSIVYDRTGKVELARFGEFNRDVVTFDEIPPMLVDATTAVEDRTFWQNSGFDPVGILSAGLDAVRGRARGASTITQQLVRQRLLNDTGSAETQVTASRKIKEIIQSIRVTQAYPGVEGKQRIMAAYLNQNFYGNDSYGVAAAAQSYFGKDLKDLTLAQAAILAALPKSPSTYDLVANAETQCKDPNADPSTCTDTQLVVPASSDIVQRRNYVLDQMQQEGGTPLTGTQLTAADFQKAKAEPVVLAPQKSNQWLLPQFVYQVRNELTARLCGADAQTCPALERGGLTITTSIDMRLQKLAEKWVKAAAIVPHAKDPKAAAKALGLTYQPWMQNLRNKTLRNGALIAEDYQTGQILAYQGSADPTSTTSSSKFQPRFDVLSDGWRQPGSAFKPVVYSTGIDEKKITAATMFMDVVTDFGGNYVPTDADNLERGPVRVQDALRFSLNIPAVKAAATIGNDAIQQKAQDMGIQFQGGQVNATYAFPLGVQEVHPRDLVRAYGTLGNGGKIVPQTTLVSVTDSTGTELLKPDQVDKPKQVLDKGTAGIMTDILAGNTDPSVNPFWGAFEIVDNGKRRPATLKTGTNNDARDLNAYGYIGAPSQSDRANGEYALAVGAWNGNSDNSLVSTPSSPLFSIDVTTYVWQGFLKDATRGWSINGFTKPKELVQEAVDPWTGLQAQPGGKAVNSLFLPGTQPTTGVPQGACGEAVLQVAGVEKNHDNWMKANRGWLARAAKGPGVRGGPQGTKTAYFYNGLFRPYGNSWGPLAGSGCAGPSASPSANPCASFDPFASVDPNASLDPCASAPPSAAPSESLTPTEAPTEPPTEAPTPPPTEAPTPPPTEAPTPPPTPVPSSPATPAPAGSASPGA
jgi:peptidoglycan glycosyltransferase